MVFFFEGICGFYRKVTSAFRLHGDSIVVNLSDLLLDNTVPVLTVIILSSIILTSVGLCWEGYEGPNEI